MSKFIGVKMVEAVPMTASEALQKDYRVGQNGTIIAPATKGYEVTYPDGYKSWSPKDVFEASYYQIQDSNGETLYRNDVEGFINKVESVKIGNKTTNVLMTCLTGYEINAQSVCIDKNNYDMSIGEIYAKPKAIDAILAHLNFVLQWARNGLHRNNNTNVPPHLTRMLVEQEALGDKITKLQMFINNNTIYNTLSETKKTLMIKQLTVMDEYFHILEERIKEESVSK